MGQSLRINTNVGIDKNISFQLDQDFEFLEQEGGGWPRTDYCEKWIREFNRDEFEGRAHIIRSYNKYINSQFK